MLHLLSARVNGVSSKWSYPPPPSIKKIMLVLPVYKGPGTLLQETVVFVGLHCVLEGDSRAHCQGSDLLLSKSCSLCKPQFWLYKMAYNPKPWCGKGWHSYVWLNLRVHLTVLLLCCIAIHWVWKGETSSICFGKNWDCLSRSFLLCSGHSSWFPFKVEIAYLFLAAVTSRDLCTLWR